MVCSSIAGTATDMTGDLYCKNSCLRHGSLIYLIYFVNRNLKERVFPLIYLLIYFVNRKFSYSTRNLKERVFPLRNGAVLSDQI